jgi:hypothetical protein
VPINPLRAVPDDLFLVRVERAQYRWHAQQPHCALRLEMLEPKELAGRLIAGHVYAHQKRFGSSVGFSGNDTIKIPGFPAGRVDLEHGWKQGFKWYPNWRQKLLCCALWMGR